MPTSRRSPAADIVRLANALVKVVSSGSRFGLDQAPCALHVGNVVALAEPGEQFGQCLAVGGVGLNFGNANPNSTTVNPDILGGWGVRPHDWQIGVSVQHELVPRVSVEAGYNRRWWGNFFVTDNVLTTAADYDTYSLVIPTHENLPGAGELAPFVAITQEIGRAHV